MSGSTTGGGGGPAPARSAAVDGIRGAAALALLTVHVAMFSGLFGSRFYGPEQPPSNFWGAFVVSGFPSFIGVFFVLPAMYLYLPLAKAIIAGRPRPTGQGRAFVKRLLKLLPAYYVLVLVCMVALNRDEIDGPWFVLRPLLLLQVYLPSPFTPKLMNGLEITWTVPTMVQWYALLPVIAWVAHRFARRGTTPRARAARLMLPVPVLVAIGVTWVFVVKSNGWDNRIVFWWPQGFAPTMGIGMALAIGLALAKVAPDQTPRVLRAAASRPGLFWLGAAVTYLVNCARPFSVIGMDAIYSTAGLLVTYLMVAAFGLFAVTPLVAPGGRGGPRIVMALLRSGPLVHAGRVSYGIYLWHFAVMHFYLQGDKVLDGGVRPLREYWAQAGFWELELVTITGAVLLATVSHHLVEIPAARWGEWLLDRWFPARRPRDGDGVPHRTEAAAELDERDVVRANLVELESGTGIRLLDAAHPGGTTGTRWRAARADLATLWTLFAAWSDVLDRAARSDQETARTLLDGPSVVLPGPPAPLAARRITDCGVTRLTPDEALDRMNALFGATAQLVSAVEEVSDLVGAELDAVAAELEQRLRAADDAPTAAHAERLEALRAALREDPLRFWLGGAEDGYVDLSAADALRAEIAARPERRAS